ncbi:hypothetical protein M1N21_00310 [Dehalococcoidia bacterium]|nr:hypothetical protein [Dehalococcoidia bacterium]
MRLYPYFRRADRPATGLALSDIKVTILRVTRVDKSVSVVVNAQPAQAEVGKGYYAFYYDAANLDLYDYLPIVEYVGIEDVYPVALAGRQLDADVHSRTAMAVGAKEWTYTLLDEVSGLPIPDADVWVTSDAQGEHKLASGRTDQQGRITFYLDPGGIYIWRQKSGWNFFNPVIGKVT